jgi:DNA replication protein DnaC
MSVPNPYCPDCGGAGILVDADGELAVARVCHCVPPCPRCGGSGRVLVELDGIPRMARCRCQLLPDRVALFNKANIPARHRDSTFKNFRTELPGVKPGYDFALSWARSYQAGQENRGLVLFGQVGRGKTHLLIATLRLLVLEKGVQARFIEFSHLLSELKAGFEKGEGTSRTLHSLASVEVLAIDELGKGRNTEFEHSVVDELISRRYNGVRTTLATTNYAPGRSTGVREPNLAQPQHQPNLIDRVGGRVYSRLTEMADFRPVLGEDFRSRVGRAARVGR